MELSDVGRRWQNAVSTAALFHRHQLRKDGKTPYVSHPFRVAMTVRHVFGVDDDAVIAAALLHDIIEDTQADYEDVLGGFGSDVADIVSVLSKDMRLPENIREKSYHKQLESSSWKVKIIKLADVYDNICDYLDSKAGVDVISRAEHAIAICNEEIELEGPLRLLRQLIEQNAEALEKSWKKS